MTITEIRQLLESPYNQKEWKVFLQSHFTNGKLFGDAHTIELTDKTISKKCYSLGNYEVNEYTKIGIFEVQLNDNVKLTRNRVGLRSLIKSITAQVAGAMVVFVQGDKWRFSYISKRKVRNKDTNTIEDKETAPKRYTYLFGKNEKALTAAQRFDQLIQKQKENLFQSLTLNDFEDAFSVERLSKEFFDQYKKTYEDFVEYLTGKRYKKSGNRYLEQVIKEPNYQLRNLFGNDEKQARDFCKRMMGRIVFLYFIQKKGWMAVGKDKKWGDGNPDYLYDLFKKSKHKDDFYSQELVPLFFKTLNNTASEKETNTFRFPYLNGGLFDDSHDRKFNKLALPTEIFENLFSTFNNFNFTIYEDAPDEHTVAVDPEMLGHIFENLLEDNKDKGAFYTPKEIVHYMCRESLTAYLIASEELNIADNPTGKETINKIIQQQELKKEEIQFAEKNAFKIINALEQVKICDPAIGSGAFPMGILQEIFNAQIYLQEIKGFTRKQTEAEIKKHIIEESIYGVDIDAGAVDIARLRFWLSLVVDENEPQPLPNLSFKIVCANTLIPLGKLKGDFGGTHEIAEELSKVRHDYFNASMEEKTALETKFTSLQKKLLTTAKDWVTKEDAEVYQKLLEFSPFEESSCSWFDAWWMFGLKEGFDVVIGNPPYVQLQKESGRLAKLYQHCGYKTFAKTGDIYSLFYERGWQLLKNKGLLCYITSNKWMRAGYGESTREFFATNTNPILLIDFAGQKIFESATVETNILLFSKDKNRQQTRACVIQEKVLNNLSVYFRQNAIVCNFSKRESWVVLSEIEQRIKAKIEAVGVPLKDWDINIYRGILTGLTEAFIIDEKTKNDIIQKDPQSKEIIRPVLKGRNISTWYPTLEKQYIIFAHNGSKKENIKPVNIERDYKGIFEWFKNYEEKLKARQDQGDEWYNLRSCAYLNDFEKPKIIYREITQKFDFSFDNGELLFIDTAWMMVGENLKYLTVFFNSKLFNYCFRDNFTDLGSGGRRLKKVFFEKIPVKKITTDEEIPFAKIVDYLVELKKENSQEPTDQFMFIYFEQIANALVYELYFKEAFAKEGFEVASYVAQLPDIDKKSKEPIILQIRKAYIKAHEQGSPIRNAVEGITTIPQINLINNSVTL